MHEAKVAQPIMAAGGPRNDVIERDRITLRELAVDWQAVGLQSARRPRCLLHQVLAPLGTRLSVAERLQLIARYLWSLSKQYASIA